jgi:hypothetical protein
MSMYWYVSTAKVDLLSQQHRNALAAIKELAVKLKSPVAEAELRLAVPDPVLLAKLRQVENKIIKEADPPSFDVAADEDPPPAYIMFDIPGARLVSADELWLAGHANGVALVLVGAAKHSFGGVTQQSDMSPSIDPLGAIVQLASGNQSFLSGPADAAASYAWSTIMRHNGQNKVRLPAVSGLAVTIGVVPAYRSQIRRAGIPDIEKVVVGTPLYIVQY